MTDRRQKRFWTLLLAGVMLFGLASACYTTWVDEGPRRTLLWSLIRDKEELDHQFRTLHLLNFPRWTEIPAFLLFLLYTITMVRSYWVGTYPDPGFFRELFFIALSLFLGLLGPFLCLFLLPAIPILAGFILGITGWLSWIIPEEMPSRPRAMINLAAVMGIGAGLSLGFSFGIIFSLSFIMLMFLTALTGHLLRILFLFCSRKLKPHLCLCAV